MTRPLSGPALRAEIGYLLSELVGEIENERQFLRSIGGPTGMRNSQASSMGLARNDVRNEVITKLAKILEAEEQI